MINNLIVSKTNYLQDINNYDEQFILIGHWLLEDFSADELDKFKFKICNPVSYLGEKRKHNYIFCEQIFESIFNDFFQVMNDIHNVNLSKRAWRIISESWLKRLIYICFNRKETIESAIDEFPISNIYLKSNKNFKFFTKDCEGQYACSVNDIWNSNIYSKLINFFNYDLSLIVEKNNEEFINLETYSDRIIRTKKNIKVKIALNSLKFNRIFANNKDGIIFNSYLPFIAEKFIEFNLKQAPQFWEESFIDFKKFNTDNREKISFFKNNNKNLENFIRDILPICLPISFMESFHDIFNNSGHSGFPLNPKFVLISNGFDHDEKLKFFIAKLVDKGTAYYVGQHGASYFTEHDANFRAEVNTSDKFLSWGYHNEKKKNIEPMFNFKTFKRRIKNDNRGNFVIICRSLGYRAAPWDRYFEGLMGIKKVSQLLSVLPIHIQEMTLVRLHKSFKLDRAKYFVNKYFDLYSKNLEFGEINYRSLIKKSRLVCFNYDSTGFLENLHYNVPSVCIWDNTFNHINNNFMKKYEILLDARILFDNEKELKKHLIKIWDNVESWWNAKATQSSLLEFNKNFNIKGEFKDLKKITELLKNYDSKTINKL
jgi:putative transferase (TIGR04331 family)